MGKIQLKYASLDDLHLLQPLINHQLKETNQNYDNDKAISFLKECIKKPQFNIIIIHHQKLLGASLCNIESKFWSNVKYGNIQWFYILPPYRNYYNAKTLLKASEEWLKNFDIEYIQTDVWHLDKDLHCDNKYITRYNRWSLMNNYRNNGQIFYKVI